MRTSRERLLLFEVGELDAGAVVILNDGVVELLLEGLAEFGQIFLAKAGAPLPAPPRPLPLAAPSARQGRLRDTTRGRRPAKVSTLSRAQAGSALHTSREQFPSTDWGTVFLVCFCFFKSF